MIPRSQLKTFILHTLPILSVSLNECLQIETKEPESSKTVIIKYLLKGTLPTDREKTRKLRTQATRYVIIAYELY